MLLEKNGKLTMWKSKSSRLSYSLVESLPPLSMMKVEKVENVLNRPGEIGLTLSYLGGGAKYAPSCFSSTIPERLKVPS